MHFRWYFDIGIKKKSFRDSEVRAKKSEENAMNLQRIMSEQKLFWEKGLTRAADCCKIKSIKELLLCRFRYYNPRLSWILKLAIEVNFCGVRNTTIHVCREL